MEVALSYPVDKYQLTFTIAKILVGKHHITVTKDNRILNKKKVR